MSNADKTRVKLPYKIDVEDCGRAIIEKIQINVAFFFLKQSYDYNKMYSNTLYI